MRRRSGHHFQFGEKRVIVHEQFWHTVQLYDLGRDKLTQYTITPFLSSGQKERRGSGQSTSSARDAHYRKKISESTITSVNPHRNDGPGLSADSDIENQSIV